MRMGSSRLPGKVMLPLGGIHVLQHVVRRVRNVNSIGGVVLATSSNQADDIVATYGDREGVSVFRGPEQDVLGRVFAAAKKAGANTIVRVTGDCPLVSPNLLEVLIDQFERSDVDYASTRLKRTFPAGTGAEIFTYQSFKTVHTRAESAYAREHVTSYYYDNPSDYSLLTITSEDIYSNERYRDRTDLKLTLDTAEDYERLRQIFEGLGPTELLDLRNVIDYTDANGLTNSS